MDRLFKTLVICLFPITVVASRPAFFNRDSLGRETFSCSTPCGSGWCCNVGEKCQVANAGDTPYDHTPYICLDFVLTNSDGSPMTWPALNPTILPTNIAWISTELSLISSAQSALEAPSTGTPTATTSPGGGGQITTSATPKTASTTAPTSAANTQSRVAVGRGIIWALGFVNAFILWISV